MLKQDELHPDDKRNLIIFCVAAVVIWLGFNHFILQPRLDSAEAAHKYALQHTATPADLAAHKPRPRDAVLAESPRLAIDNGAVFGSVALKGGRLDDLSLSRYSATAGKNDHVMLLSPAGTEHPEYVESGWITTDKTLKLPDADTVWHADGAKLGPEDSVQLSWDNGQGLRFTRILQIDGNYLITQTDQVANQTGRPVALSHYDLISQHGLPADIMERGGRVFEGADAYLDGKLVENNYNTMTKTPLQTVTAANGWIGLSQKYWFTGLIPTAPGAKTYRFVHTPSPDPVTGNKAADLRRPDLYQVDVTAPPQTIAAGAKGEVQTRILAGAKGSQILQHYADAMPGSHLDLVIDWGLYWFLTRPFFFVLDFLGRHTGNFGVALVCLTIVVRLAVFPLANTSFKSFAKMKKIAPQLKEVREKHGDNKDKLQEALVSLYEKEKVNPMAGCLPLFLQIPIFFALYKVLSVTIELRHAPFFGWIHDLSAQDPTTVFNLFGLVPWTPPAWMPMFGGWSCLMLLAMLAQRQLSPPAQDKSQQMTANLMPFMVTYVMSKFPAGLVVYWTFSNTFSVLQQYVIMRSLGAEVYFFRRSKEDKDMEKLVASQPEVHPGLATAIDEGEKALTEDQPPRPVTPPKPKRKTKR